MKLSLTLLLLLPISVFSRLTTMKHPTGMMDVTTKDKNNRLSGSAYFEDSLEEHPEMRGLLGEINGQELGNDNDQPKTRALGGKKCYWYHGYKRCYYHHEKHYKPYYH